MGSFATPLFVYLNLGHSRRLQAPWAPGRGAVFWKPKDTEPAAASRGTRKFQSQAAPKSRRPSNGHESAKTKWQNRIKLSTFSVGEAVCTKLSDLVGPSLSAQSVPLIVPLQRIQPSYRHESRSKCCSCPKEDMGQ